MSRATQLTLLGLAAAALALVYAAGAQQPLPAAPSTVLAAQLAAQQNEALAKPAGSGLSFLAPSTQPGPAGVLIEAPKDGPLLLSLDDAISIALQRNIRIKYDQGNQRAVKGDSLGVLDALLPNLTLNAASSTQELNLAAMGFSPILLSKFSSTGLIPAGYHIATIVKVNVTQASLSASQTLFNLTDYEIYRGTKNESAVVDLGLLNDHGDVILNVATPYLQILADQANLANARAQARSSKALFDQASAKQTAGVGIHLDTLRAQVQHQQDQQTVLSDQNQLDKDTIQLTRVLGIPASQPIQLTDNVPFADLAAMDLETANLTALAHRKDFLSIEQQIDLTVRELKAVRYQRLPTVAFNGYYGVIGVTNGSYHGDFNAAGSLNFPIFREAAQRGEQEVVDGQLAALRQREADLRVAMDAQIRSSMLDVTSSAELVKVAQSNVDLAKQELSDEQQRFSAGVDDNLPVVDAEASLTSAEAQLVQALYQYNVAKLQLARNTGVIETRYRVYLGK
jgi:outer membrane protein TolC